MRSIDDHLKAARESLLDLTMRNRLLNFRSSKRRTIRVIEEIPREIYDFLVLKEKPMTFLPREEKEGNESEDADASKLESQSENPTDLPKEEAKILWEAPVLAHELGDQHLDKYLQTASENESLQKRLFYINQQAKSAVEEQGYTILYLALGFLEWTESANTNQIRHAPLILVPVELERAHVKSTFNLRWTGEDIFTNISLKQKLAEQGIDFPDFEMPEDKDAIDSYFQKVSDAVSAIPRWNVVMDVFLGFFSFTKFVMYKDLDPSAWPSGQTPADHPLIKAIFDPESAEIDREPSFSEDEVDLKLRAHDIYHVMDADPSQIATIEDLKAGRNLVVEGPPGTGKSQTITNAIAELIAAGKSVLFVSEKMAALEVVKERLDRVGLGDFCLELHSRKANKKDVLNELERALKKAAPNPTKAKDELNQLEQLKVELNEYAKALREPIGKLGRSPFSLYCIRGKAKNHFETNGRSEPKISFSPDEIDQSSFMDSRNKLKNLSEAVSLVNPIDRHPWRFSRAKVILPSDEDEISTQLESTMAAVRQMQEKVQEFSKLLCTPSPVAIEKISRFTDALHLIHMPLPYDKKVALENVWDQAPEAWLRPISKVEEFQTLFSPLSETFGQDALDADIQTLTGEIKLKSKNLFRLFDEGYRKSRKEVNALYKAKSPWSNRKIIGDLEKLGRCQVLRNEIRTLEPSARALFGNLWKNELSDPKGMREFSEWAVKFRKLLKDGIVSAEALNTPIPVDLEEITSAFKKVHETLSMELEGLCKKTHMGSDQVFGPNNLIQDLYEKLNVMKADISKLRKWAQYYSIREDNLTNPVLLPLIELLERGEIMAAELIPAFELNVAEAFLRLAFNERPALASFDGDLHEKKIGRFAELDREIIKMNRKRLREKLYENMPKITSGASPGSEAGILLGEFSKKRRHMPIRKLLFHAGHLIQRIKPCFMMSPLSIAQFLDPKSIRFDVIIFDEASQVRPQDALGALIRGRQASVLGDTRQLPPTSFFDHMVELDDEDEEEITAPVSDVESILHLCKRSFPAKLLKWHYRSKHESLIAVSNQEFYDNDLLIYPSAFHEVDHLGLKFNFMPDSVYDRGRSSVNRKEAQAVARAAIDHYRKTSDKSLGVGAFNIKQQQAILEEVELQLRLNPDMEEYFSSSRHEHFFVKNLETIQGDERDVIFLSVGFGFDETKRLSRNFGPVNQEGGERRLNVLISRARERCVVFANFRASDLDVDSSSPFGLRALKTFLDYAENRNLQSLVQSSEDTDSPFEDSVYSFLKNNGYEVRKQVGCARFRIDLAIVDPKNPGKYLMAIECDGAKYHSSPVARDRDRLRDQILRGLGWKIHRIWSTDWYRNRRDSETKLLAVLKSARESSAQNSSETMATEKAEHGSFASDENDPITDSHQEATLGDEIPVDDYQTCTDLLFKNHGDLHIQDPKKLAQNVIRVVEAEGPIHFDEMVKRIRSLWGLRRTGDRIINALRRSVDVAKKQGEIEARGAFLWPRGLKLPKVRRRTEDPRPDIELICPEEIKEAVRLVLKSQFSTAPDELSVAASRLLGFQATRDDTNRKIQEILSEMIQAGELEKMPNGLIHFRIDQKIK